MLYYDYGIVNVATLYQSLLCKEFYFVEENKGPARTDFCGIIVVNIVGDVLHSEDSG